MSPRVSKSFNNSLFFDRDLNIEQLSRLLFICFGYLHGEEPEHIPFKRRTSPSGGCLQLIEPYLLIFNVKGIDSGIYFYDAEAHELAVVNSQPCSYKELAKCLGGQFYGRNCSLGIFLTADIERLHWKYKTVRNYRVVMMEAGHFSQTLQLALTADDLQHWITGAFMDSRIERLLKLHPLKQAVLFFIGVGQGEFKSMDAIMADVRKRYSKNNS